MLRSKSSGVLSFSKFADLQPSHIQRIMVFFDYESLFGSTVEAEKIREGYIARCFNGAITSQFVIDKDLCED